MSPRIQMIKSAPPPPELPIFGKSDAKKVSYFGRTNYAAALEEKKFIFGIKREDRGNHIYMIGKSGVGKTKLMELLIRQDIAYGYGLCLMDPEGGLISSILDFVPENRVGDVVIIDPSDSEHPVSFNPFAGVDPALKHQLAEGFIGAMKKQFGADWTPRMEHIFRFTCLALLDYPHSTMRGMISMLTDADYRRKAAEFISDAAVKRFWEEEFADWSEKFDTDAIIPLVSKLSQFLLNPMLRNIFGEAENRIDLERLIKEKKIILVNLAKSRLGDEGAGFFGSIFLTKMNQAGIARGLAPEKDRHDFYFYIDEFNNVITDTFENIISESRKYGFCLTLSNRYLDQLTPQVQSAILGNVGTIIIFRVGGDDAIKLKPEMAPIFDAKDMINLGAREFYIKMIIEGQSYDPFSAETLAILNSRHPSFREDIIRESRARYSSGK